jgi:hypothetical protein
MDNESKFLIGGIVGVIILNILIYGGLFVGGCYVIKWIFF